MVELGEHISSKVTDGFKTVSDNLIECRNQILAEKEISTTHPAIKSVGMSFSQGI